MSAAVQSDGDETGMTAIHAMLQSATLQSLRELFARHPYESDDVAVMALITAALWEKTDADIAEFCGISQDAAKFLNGFMVAAACVPSLSESALAEEESARLLRSPA